MGGQTARPKRTARAAGERAADHGARVPGDHAFASDPARGLLFGVQIPMVASLGLVGEAIEPDYARIRLPFRAEFANSAGHLHGGALMTALDCVLACAARSRDPAGTRVITIDMSTHFIASTSGDAIAEARCLRRGRSIAFSQGEVRDLHGRLLATATGAFKPVPRDAPGGDG